MNAIRLVWVTPPYLSIVSSVNKVLVKWWSISTKGVDKGMQINPHFWVHERVEHQIEPLYTYIAKHTANRNFFNYLTNTSQYNALHWRHIRATASPFTGISTVYSTACSDKTRAPKLHIISHIYGMLVNRCIPLSKAQLCGKYIHAMMS